MHFRRVVLATTAIFLITPVVWGKIDTVKVRDYTFLPSSLTIQAGDTVVWKVIQQCCLFHTVTRTASPMSWDSGDLTVGGTFLLVFPNTGSFGYSCQSHEGIGMVGSIIVLPPPPLKTPALGWLGLGLLAASLAAVNFWLLERKQTRIWKSTQS